MHSLNLRRILNPISEANFLLEYFGRQPVVLPGPRGRFASLQPELSAYTDGDRLDETNAATGTLAGRLERALEADVQIHLWSASAGSLQTSERDLLVMWIEGESHWRIHRKSADPDPDQKPAWSGMLKPGDALYIPRGWPYEASASTASALRISIQNPTGADLVDWLVGQLRHSETALSDIPRFGGPAEQADFVRSLRRPIVQALRTPGLLMTYARYRQLRGARRTLAGVEWRQDLAPEHLIDFAGTRRLQLLRRDPETLFIVSGGKQLNFPGDASPLLQYLTNEAPVTIGEFYETFRDEFDQDELSDFLAALSRDGVVVFWEPYAG